MKEIIFKLIADDIKITRLINTLSKLKIDAGEYYTNTPAVVFELMNIKQGIANEKIFAGYSRIMDQRCHDIAQTDEQDKLLVEEIYTFLLSESN